MTGHTSDGFFDGLVHEARFPVVWDYLDSEPEEKQLIAANEANEQLLRLMTSLGERLPEANEDVEYNAELARLDLKLTVLLDMVGQMVLHQLNLPDKELIKLGHGSMEWRTAVPPDVGRLINFKVYIDPELPSPLSLYGVVERGNIEAQTDRLTAIRVKYRGLSEAVKNELEKYIFRQHRKKIAFEKHSAIGS